MCSQGALTEWGMIYLQSEQHIPYTRISEWIKRGKKRKAAENQHLCFLTGGTMLPITLDLTTIRSCIHLNNELKQSLLPLLLLPGALSQQWGRETSTGTGLSMEEPDFQQESWVRLQEVGGWMSHGHPKIFQRKMKGWSQESLGIEWVESWEGCVSLE